MLRYPIRNPNANTAPTPFSPLTQRFFNRHLWVFCSIFWVFAVLSSALGRFLKSGWYIIEAFVGYFVWTFPWWIGNVIVMPFLIAAGCHISQQYQNKGIKLLLIIGAVVLAQAVHVSMGVHTTYLIDTILPNIEHRVIDTMVKALHYYNEHNLWYVDIQMFILYILLGIAWQWQESASEAKLEGEKLQRKLAQSEMTTFRAQLNPHFLFNLLNGISALVRTGRTSHALKSLSELSHLLRGIIEDRSFALNELSRELHLVAHYIELQTIRFGDKLQFIQDVPQQAMDIRVPGMLLLPLIENAIEHGSKTSLNITFKADVRQDKLNMSISNPVDELSDNSGFGIGLGNNLQRLKLIYGDNFSIEKTIENGIFRLEIQLPKTAVDLTAE